jgi:hypothetical protein
LASQFHKVFVETAVPVCMQNAATAPLYMGELAACYRAPLTLTG